jgi:hypothetical protein
MTYIVLAVVAFVLHIIWENLHVRLYTGYEHLSPKLPITVYATIGDVMYTLGAVLLIALFKGNLEWMQTVHLTDIAGLAIVGIFIAVLVEYKALTLRRWSYLPEMPIIPTLNIGYSPVMQMTLLLPLSVALTSWLF